MPSCVTLSTRAGMSSTQNQMNWPGTAAIAQAESLRRLQQAVEAAGDRHDYAAAVAWQSEVVAACRSDAGQAGPSFG